MDRKYIAIIALIVALTCAICLIYLFLDKDEEEFDNYIEYSEVYEEVDGGNKELYNSIIKEYSEELKDKGIPITFIENPYYDKFEGNTYISLIVLEDLSVKGLSITIKDDKVVNINIY